MCRKIRAFDFVVRFMNGVSEGWEADLLRKLIDDTDMTYTRWATEQLLKWKNPEPVNKLVHIHGTADRLLPINNTKPDIKVEGGSHFMIVSRAKEISKIIKQVIAGLGNI